MSDYRILIYRPVAVFSARVNMTDPVEYPVHAVVVDTVSFGSIVNAKQGMTVIFGSGPGLDDLGRSYIRLQSISPFTELFIGFSPQGVLDGEVDIYEDCYVSVLDDYRVWAKIPYANPETKVKYKDGDKSVGDNALFPPPVANGGGPAVATIDSDTEVITVEFDATESFIWDISVDGISPATSLSWDVEDGEIVEGNVNSPTITAIFPAGFRYVKLLAHSGEGASHIHKIPVYARDPANDLSFEKFQILSRTHAIAGQNVSVKIMEDIPRDQYLNGSMVLIWKGEPTQPEVRDNIIFYGWIATERSSVGGQETGTMNEVILDLVDVAGRLRLLPGFSQVQEYAAVPDDWSQTKHPHILYYLWYLLYWHSTAIDVASLRSTSPESLTDLEFNTLSSDAADLFTQAESLCQASTPDHRLSCTRLGQLLFTVDPIIMATTVRDLIDIQATLNPGNITVVTYTYSDNPKVHELITGAIVGTRDPIIPPDKPFIFTRTPKGWRGQGVQKVETSNRIANGQTSMNIIEGNRYARINAPYSHFQISIFATGDALDIDPGKMEWTEVSIPQAYLRRDDELLLDRGLVHQITYSYNHTETGTTEHITIDWEMETFGPPGETYEMPEVEEE